MAQRMRSRDFITVIPGPLTLRQAGSFLGKTASQDSPRLLKGGGGGMHMALGVPHLFAPPKNRSNLNDP
eukprot:993779-Pyramimonas_sp.AAC.1